MRVRKNWRFSVVSIISLFSIIWISQRKARKNLSKSLQKQLGFDGNILLTKSGRSALYILTNHLYINGYRKVLIPFRLCNVVKMTLQKAGMDVYTYNNYNDLEFLLSDFSLSKNKIPILLVATYFNERIDKSFIADMFLEKFGTNAPIIFDECQSVHNFSFYNKYYSLENKYILLSFNDKYVPGIMGGALINKNEVNFETRKMQAKQEFYFFLYLLKSLMDFSFCKIQKRINGEFSHCEGFRYEIDNYKISYASSLVAFRFLKVPDKLRKWFFNNNQIINKIDNGNFDLRVYYLINQDIVKRNENLPIKGPYLIRGNEPIEEAIEKTGGVFLTNSFKYKYCEK